MSPIVVGRYVLHDAIASGGMATVHVGRLIGEVGFSRTVAIKRLHPHFAKTQAFVSMFMDEARLASRIRHPNVVPVIDVVSANGELLLVMEYVHGETLARLMRRTKARGEKVPPPIANAIMIDVLDGLHAAHEARDERGEPLDIVHRDVSPQNIIVGADGITRVLDFGVAKATGRLQETREGQLKGKLSYMAPEQLDQETTRASDVFCAGIVLWEALTGERLFQGESEAQTVMRVLAAHVEPPSRVAGITDAFDSVVLRALAAAPTARFASAREMASALAKFGPRAERHDIVGWLDTLAHDELAARAELVSSIESTPSREREKPSTVLHVRSAGVDEVATNPGVPRPGGNVVVSKRSAWLMLVGAAVVVGAAAIVLEGAMTSATAPTDLPERAQATSTPTAMTTPTPTTTPLTTSEPLTTTQPRPTPFPVGLAPDPSPSMIVVPMSRDPKAPRGSMFQQASSLASSGDPVGARALLEPRVFGSGAATPDEVKLLQGICKSQHDRSCVAAITAKYP